MTDALVFVIGIGVAALITYFISSSLSDEHEAVKFLLMMALFAFLLLLPKVFGDASNICTAVEANHTVVGNVTSYSYAEFCFTKDSTTTGTLMKIVYWVYYLVMGYITVFLFWKALMSLWGRKGGSNG